LLEQAPGHQRVVEKEFLAGSDRPQRANLNSQSISLVMDLLGYDVGSA